LRNIRRIDHAAKETDQTNGCRDVLLQAVSSHNLHFATMSSWFVVRCCNQKMLSKNGVMLALLVLWISRPACEMLEQLARICLWLIADGDGPFLPRPQMK
jgi:hypothetical protein